MGKTALKSVLYTLLSMVLLIVIGFGLACLIAPGKLSDFMLDLNCNKFSALLSGAEYDRSGDINDLGTAVERYILSEMDSQTVEYGKKLIDDKNFNDFAAYKTEQMNGIPYKNYIYACYTYSLYRVGNREGSLAFAISVQQPLTNYLVNNPMSRYIDAFVLGKDSKDSDITDFLIPKAAELEVEQLDKATLKRVYFDLYRTYEAVGNEAGSKVWLDKYNNA